MYKTLCLSALAAALTLALGGPALAQDAKADEHASHHAAASAVAVAGELSQGTVRKIDRSSGKITLAHGELKNLGMPGMTMTFKAADESLLDGLKPGDAVRFRAERRGKTLVVSEIRRAAAR